MSAVFDDLGLPFVHHPERSFAVAATLFALFAATWAARRWRPRVWVWPMFVAGAAWTLFGVLEAEAMREHADIRVDLLFTVPAVFMITAACVIAWLYGIVRQRARR
jgi:hypothetical protein